MATEDQDFKSAHEVGKIFNSLMEKKILSDFFLQSTQTFVNAQASALYLKGNASEKMWQETSLGDLGSHQTTIESEAEQVLENGRPVFHATTLLVRMMVRNNAIGVACFLRADGSGDFNQQDCDVSFDLASQAASALKNLLLFEENVRMERLAAVGQTVSMVMHEIKNILQIAKLGDELVRRGLKDDNQKFITHGMDGMGKAIREMDGFVWDMLSLTKDYRLDFEEISLQELLDELNEDLHEKAAQLRIQLEFCIDPKADKVHANSRALYRALLNLVQNAMEACDKEESKIRVWTEPAGEGDYRIIIEDNGQGMNDETKAKLFQAFFSTKGSRGNGLGLLIISKTIHAHHGKVDVQSEVGKGTTFSLTLPQKPPQD